MNFANKISEQLSKNESDKHKAYALADLLIPQIMYIPHDQIYQVLEQIAHFQTNSKQTANELFLLELIQSFLIYRKNDYQLAIDRISNFRSSSYSEIDSFNIASSFCIEGACYRSIGHKENALKAFHSSIDQFEDVPSKAYQKYLYGLAFYHVGELHAELDDFDGMLEKQKRFYEIGSLFQNVDMVNRALNGIGRAYLGLKDFRNSLKYLKLAEQNSKAIANIPFKAKNLHDIGMAFLELKEYDNAIVYLRKALAVREKHSLNDAIISSYIGIAKVQIAQSFFENAIKSLHQAHSLMKNMDVKKMLATIYQLLSYAYEQDKQFELALDYYKKYQNIQEAINDIKATQKENERIRESNTELRRQKNIISEQKKTIESYVAKLADANNSLQNFAYIAAHDLKAPIRITNNFIDILQKKNNREWDDKEKTYFDIIAKNLSQLSTMIDNLLSLSKLDQDLPPVESIDMNQLIKNVLIRLEGKISKANPIIFIPDDLPAVMGHPSLIVQLFQNLLDNAIKYRRDEMLNIEISNRFATCSDEETYIQFEIEDNGKGIAADFQEKMFELFSRTKGKISNGIGLATCKKIVANYGGNIWVKSKEGEGTTVFFTLPAVEKT